MHNTKFMYMQHSVGHSKSILSKSMCACKHFKLNALLYTQHSIAASQIFLFFITSHHIQSVT